MSEMGLDFEQIIKKIRTTEKMFKTASGAEKVILYHSLADMFLNLCQFLNNQAGVLKLNLVNQMQDRIANPKERSNG